MKLKDRPKISQLNVEVTNACTLRCVMCPHPMMTREIGRMDFDLFQKIAGEAADFDIPSLPLHVFGDPLLHPELERFISFAKTNGIPDVHISTNAIFLTEDRSRSLLETGLDTIYLCLDGIKKETYERLRVNAKFEQVVVNIKKFISLKRELNVEKPAVKLQIVRMKDTEPEIEDFVREWESQVDEIYINPYDTWAGVMPDRAVHERPKKRTPCPQLWRHLTILWSGDVSICCRDYDGQGVIDNIRKVHLKEIFWFNQKLLQHRRDHLEGNYHKVPLCAPCNEWYK